MTRVVLSFIHWKYHEIFYSKLKCICAACRDFFFCAKKRLHLYWTLGRGTLEHHWIDCFCRISPSDIFSQAVWSQSLLKASCIMIGILCFSAASVELGYRIMTRFCTMPWLLLCQDTGKIQISYLQMYLDIQVHS